MTITRATLIFFFFFFNDTATTEIYTLSLHDALPIFLHTLHTNLEIFLPNLFRFPLFSEFLFFEENTPDFPSIQKSDRKSTRLNSSHANISYAVFCLKKKKNLHVRLHVHGVRR